MLQNKKLRTAQLQENKRKIDDSECAPLTNNKKRKTTGDQATSTTINRTTVTLWEMAADGNPVNTETSFKERLKNDYQLQVNAANVYGRNDCLIDSILQSLMYSKHLRGGR